MQKPPPKGVRQSTEAERVGSYIEWVGHQNASERQLAGVQAGLDLLLQSAMIGL